MPASKIAILSLFEGYFAPTVISKLKKFVPAGTYLVFLLNLWQKLPENGYIWVIICGENLAILAATSFGDF